MKYKLLFQNNKMNKLEYFIDNISSPTTTASAQ